MGRRIRNPHDPNTQAYADFEGDLQDVESRALAEEYPDEVMYSEPVRVPE